MVKDNAYVKGNVFGNAVIKDHGFVGTGVTITGNAVVQADQWINYGIVETDLLGTKNWVGTLLAEFGITPKNGKIILYKRAWNTDDLNIFESYYDKTFVYEIGTEVAETDIDKDALEDCKQGFYLTTVEFIDKQDGDSLLECEVDLEDIITVQGGIVRTKKYRIIRSL